MKTNALRKTKGANREPAKRAGRFGRPPKERAGEVDARILAAACEVFLEKGFEGASIEEIAEAARSGKPTIYARFGDKRALFTEVVMRDLLCRIAEFKPEVPTGATIEARLTCAAITLLRWGFDGGRIGLMRLAIAEARRFPDLASTVGREARELSTELGVRLLEQVTPSGELHALQAFAPERVAGTARLFLDLVAVPMLLRALFEVDLRALEAELDGHVARAVAFFLAGCRQA